jgi:endonuclease/exonuclease/phosphatase family metal-dependent hydrolase
MRFATFNLESLDLSPGGEAAFGRRAAVLAPQLDRLHADVLCLQEVNGQHVPGQAARRLVALEQLLSETSYRDFHVFAAGTGTEKPIADVHNLAIVSRWPARHSEALRHRLVPPLPYRAVTAAPASARELTLTWDRPLLHALFDLPSGRALHVVNLHLRSPLAAPIPGGKLDADRWGSLGGWAEGYFTATLKRSGQALEARLLAEQLFDAQPDALLAVCGDLNAGEEETPSRILQAGVEDSGNTALAGRALEALELRLTEERRFTLRHGGHRRMLDHILCSPALAARCTAVAVDNADLADETAMAADDPRSNHAPLIAEFDV